MYENKPEVTLDDIKKLIESGVAVVGEESKSLASLCRKVLDVEMEDGTRYRAWVSSNSHYSEYYIIHNKDNVRTAYSAKVMTAEGIAREQAKAKLCECATFKKHNGVWLIHTKLGAKEGDIVEVGRRDYSFVTCKLTKVIVKKRDGTFLMAFKEIKESPGEELGLTEDEIRFYDALADNESAVRELSDEILKKIAHELTESLRQNLSVDWSARESVRVRLRLMVKRILRKYKYPPDRQDAAVELVLQQAQALGEAWALLCKESS